MIRMLRFLGAAISIAMLLFAPHPDAAHAEDISIRIAAPETPPSMHNLYLQVAYERGLFEKYGIKVSKFLQLRGGPLATQALVANEADITATDAESVMQAALAGYPIRAISAPAARLSYIVSVRKNINSFKDLQNKSFGISRAGALSQYILFPTLDKAGVPRNSLQWLPVGGSKERMLALLAGRVDGGLLYLDDALQAEKDPNAKSLARVADLAPDYPHELIVVRKEMIDQNPDAVVGIAAAIIEACRYIVTHKDDTLKIFQKYSPESDPKIAEEAYDMLVAEKVWGVNGGMTRQNMTTALTMAVDNKLLEKPLPFDQWVDFHFQDEALKRLGGSIPE